MANFFGASGPLMLYTRGVWGVVVDSEVGLIVASGASGILTTSRKWSTQEAQPTEETDEIAGVSLLGLVSSGKGSSSKYTIPKSVQVEANKALAWRKKEGRGGTSVGQNTARTLAKGGQIGIEKVRHISRYFPRHVVDKKASGYRPGEDNFPSNGRIAWALWGGDAGQRWASAIVEREEKKALTADGYGLDELPQEGPAVEDFSYDDSPDFMSEFIARVRLDGSGMDRLYKIDADNNCTVWDDGQWDDLGIVEANIWDYDRALDGGSPEDSTDKTHLGIDPESAIIIAARLFVNSDVPVTIEDIDEYESKLAVAAIDDEDWEFIDRTLLAAVPEEGGDDDGVYTPEERSENASQQVRDKAGQFAKTGSRVVVGGDPARGSGVITKLNPESGSVTVKLDNGNEIDVPGSSVEDADKYDNQINMDIKQIDTSGILGEPRTPINRSVAQLPGTLPAMRDKDVKDMLANWPAFVKSQRDSFTPVPDTTKPIGVNKRGSGPNLDVGDYGKGLAKETGKSLTTDAYDHPLLNSWLNKKDASGFAPNRLWYNPITASAEEKLVSPETTDVQPIYMAIVDADDPRAVLDLISLVPASTVSTSPMTYTRNQGKWARDPKMLADLNSPTPPPVVPLDSDSLNDVLVQVDSSQGVTASIALTVLFGNDVTFSDGYRNLKRSVVDVLRKYWIAGRGAKKIQWGVGGDWYRCVRQLAPFLGIRAKGYCQMLHKTALGYYTSTHAKMERAKMNLFEVDESLEEFTEVTSEDMRTPLQQIVAMGSDDQDDDFEIDEEIQLILSDIEALDQAEYALVAAGGADRNRGGAENLRRYWTTGKGGAKIRWGTPGDWTRCNRQLKKYLGVRAKGYCALRHKEMNGVWPGDKKNLKASIFSEFELKTEDQFILDSYAYADERSKDDMEPAPEGYHYMPDGTLMKDSDHASEASYTNPCWDGYIQIGMKEGKGGKQVPNCVPATTSAVSEAEEFASQSNSRTDIVGSFVAGAQKMYGGGQFQIPLVIPEEIDSGDGRQFTKGAIEIRELPLPLLWQIKTGDGHDGSVVVGRIDSMERTDQGIGNAYGFFDSGSYGQEAERLVRQGFLRGVSADMDRFEATEEEVEEASDTDEDDKTIKKEKIVISKARVMAVTIVPKPAFQECKIIFVDAEEENTNQEDTMIPDGVYIEDIEPTEAEAIVASGLIAGAIPVAPPKDWFVDPKMTQPTPLTVTDEGRVYGHIAAWDVDHIGMVAGTKPPRSRSKYAYFHTGVVRTEDASDVAVGQITLAGGHADIRASASEAVKHYDDTASAVIDVHAGEDAFGIWVAGSLRPGVTADQVRALRASAPSGDWRPIRGSLELVAVCQVNVPGFPIARAMVSSGQITALIAAGASVLAKMRSNPVHELDQRLSKLEKKEEAILVASAQVARAKFQALRPELTVVEEPVVADELTTSDASAQSYSIEEMRERITALRAQLES